MGKLKYTIIVLRQEETPWVKGEDVDASTRIEVLASASATTLKGLPTPLQLVDREKY